MPRDDSYPELKHLDLPEGLTWEMVREAQQIIEDWEDTPGVSDLDLITRLYARITRRGKKVE